MRTNLRSSPTSLRGARHGFTLIELLVSIAIIALMISILIPSLQLAREEGMSKKCLANLRSIMQFTLMYQDDSPGRTVIWYRYPAITGYGVTLFTPWVFGGFFAPLPEDDGYAADCELYPIHVRPLNKYAFPNLLDRDVNATHYQLDLYKCPGDKTYDTSIIGSAPTGPIDIQEVGSWQRNGSSYTFNTRFFQGYTVTPGTGTGGTFSITDPRMPDWTKQIARNTIGGFGAKFVMWMEQGCYSSMYRAGTTQPEPQRRGWHRKWSTWATGFADGHASYQYMDTRQAVSPDWTVWDPLLPKGGDTRVSPPY